MSDNTPATRRRDPVPSSYAEAMSVGATLAASGFFPDAKSEAQAAAKVIAGMELGLGPMASMNGIHIVKGKVTLGANLIAAQVKRSGRYDYRVTRHDATGCSIDFYQGAEKIGTSEFTADDAKAAGLWGNAGPWKAHPKNMLFARAMSNGAKWFTADIFAGPVYTPDELGAQVDGETGEVIDHAPPADDTGELIKSRVRILRGGMTAEAFRAVMQSAGISRDDLADDAAYYRAQAAVEVAQMDVAAEQPAAGEVATITDAQMRALHAKARDYGLDHDALHQLAHDVHGVDSMTEIPADGFDAMLEALAEKAA